VYGASYDELQGATVREKVAVGSPESGEHPNHGRVVVGRGRGIKKTGTTMSQYTAQQFHSGLRRATLYTIDEAPECSFPTKIAQKIGIFLYFSSLLNGLLEYN
jgi:hypothetical protein